MNVVSITLHLRQGDIGTTERLSLVKFMFLDFYCKANHIQFMIDDCLFSLNNFSLLTGSLYNINENVHSFVKTKC